MPYTGINSQEEADQQLETEFGVLEDIYDMLRKIEQRLTREIVILDTLASEESPQLSFRAIGSAWRHIVEAVSCLQFSGRDGVTMIEAARAITTKKEQGYE
jgi:hypothetical protein